MLAKLLVSLAMVAVCTVSSPTMVSAQATPTGGVTVLDGERLILRVDQSAPVIISKGVADSDISTLPLDNKVETIGELHGTKMTAEAGTVVASFRYLGAAGSVLQMENGLDHPIIYDAVIISPGRNGPRMERTTICPVAARHSGFEQWPGRLLGIEISNIHAPPPGDMRCSGDTGLVNPVGLSPPNICVGGDNSGSIQVDLGVDPATGERRGAVARWTMRGGASASPWFGLEYPMQGEKVGGRPSAAMVAAFVATNPLPPATHADIVLLADGKEAVRRPWRLYAEQHSTFATKHADKQSEAFFGVIPFVARGENGQLDTAMVELLRRIGDGEVKRIEVKVVGDDGALLGDAVYELQPAAVADPGRIRAALHAAEALAAAPGHCAKPNREQ